MQYGVKTTANETLRHISDTYDNIYTELKGIKPLNNGENEYIEHLIRQKLPMDRDISTWNDDDARMVFHSDNFVNDMHKQNKLNQYLNYRIYKNR